VKLLRPTHPSTPTARRLFAEFLASVDVKDRVTVVRHSGWLDIGGSRAFALPSEIINGAAKERVILAKDIAGPYCQSGSLEDWKDSVGVVAANHRFLRFSIATALAGTLLHLGGFESGCFHLHGKSSEGKTTWLRVGASVWGSGANNGYVRTWRSTANGLEATFAGSCDTCLPLDEVGQVEGRELGQALYMATGGVGKQRMRRDATLKPSHSWRVTVLSSGEHPIETKLNEDPKRSALAHAGQLVRAVDIPVRGTHGVFDAFESEDVDPAAFADQCKSATSAYYGTAGPEFVRRLIAENVSAKDVRERVEAFVRSALRDIKDRHGQVARVAQRFGLVCAAGELGVQLGILPWEQSDPLNDATALFETWLEERGGAAPYESRQAVAQVRQFIEMHGDSRFDDITLPDPDRKPVVNRAGFRRGQAEARRWLIPPEVWRNEICAGLNPRETAKTLADLHMLETDGEGKFSRSETVNGKKQRLYVLTPAIFEGWDEADEEAPEHLEHRTHPK
jgi:putative DNA primase/helicase